MSLTRRRLLHLVGGGGVGALAGCTDDGIRESLDPDRGPFSEETVSQARAVGNEAENAVLTVTTLPDGNLGTAWHIGDGYLLTNDHVVASNIASPRYQVGPYPGRREFDAELLGRKRTDAVDLALLEAPVEHLPALSYASNTELSPEQPLVSVGHPHGVGNWVTMLGSFRQYKTYEETEYALEERPREIETFTGSRGGASGAPTLRLDGTVVGCLHGGSQLPQDTAPKEVHTDFRQLPNVSTHVDATVFDAYISRWT